MRRRCVFTTHTPVEAGHDQYPYALAEQWLGGLVDPQVLHAVGGTGRLNLTRLALRLCGWVNGVADRHAETSRNLFPGFEVHAVTNGVHALTWTRGRSGLVLDHEVGDRAQWLLLQQPPDGPPLRLRGVLDLSAAHPAFSCAGRSASPFKPS